MFNSKWVINRIGLIDFWYYDDEEFYFKDGRMLLRGSNGSGKSVTMQSFIPLLLDANKSPGRLDPFGSRDRKLENYMLEEGDNREERIGYLYMEFKRADSNTFNTIGMGLRARKNKPLDTWYFHIKDGRRIGKEINLYKKDRANEKICFNKSELKTAIDIGGQVLDKQSEYMEMVNKQLFGFSNNEEYSELINLLIQLRTPKLSKDFKPTIINEILSESLQALTEDDLRPMSEAIENMDVLKTKLDALHESKKAADKIMQVYSVYNNSMLLEKTNKYIENINIMKKFKSDFSKSNQEKIDLEEVLKVSEKSIELLEQEQRSLNEQKNNLERDHYDEIKIKDNLDITQIELENEKAKLIKKEKELTNKVDKQKSLERELKSRSETAEIIKDKIFKIIEEMKEIIEDITYEEHEFMEKEIKSKFDYAYNFDFSKQKLNAFQLLIKKGIVLLNEQKIANNKYEEVSEKIHDLKADYDKKNVEIENSTNQLIEVKAELIEKINIWEEKNQLLKIDNKGMEKIAQSISDYTYQDMYLNLKDMVEPYFTSFSTVLNKENAQIETAKSNFVLERNEKQKELIKLENEKEIEPTRTESVINNRKWLEKLKIPYISFYKLIDFKEDVSKETRNNIEEALIRIGILDAIVVSKDYKETVLNSDIGNCDNYIFVDNKKVKLTENDISKLLFVDEKNNTKIDSNFNEMINNVLKSIILNEDSLNTSISLNGDFNIGIVTGNVSKHYTCKFIGETSRANNKLDTIKNIKLEIEEIEIKLANIQIDIESVNKKIKYLNDEYLNIPNVKDIVVAANFVKNYETELKKIILETEIQQKKEKSIIENVQAIKEKLYNFSKEITLKLNLENFDKTLENISDYKSHLSELEIEHNKYILEHDFIKSKEEALDDIEYDCEEIRYEIMSLEKKIINITMKLDGFMEQLKLTNYEEIKEKIDKYIRRLRELPNSIKILYGTIGETKNALVNIKEKSSTIEKELNDQTTKNEVLKQVVLQEYLLFYTDFQELNIDNESSLKKLSSHFADEKTTKNISPIQDSVSEQFHKNIEKLTEYGLTLNYIFEENELISDIKVKRIDISCKIRGKTVGFNQLVQELTDVISQHEILFKESDREIFEDILTNTIGKKISSRIYKSEQWVEKMNDLMKNMDTSNGLALSLVWRKKKAESEGQLNTNELVELLKKDSGLMKEKDTDKLAKHFRSKIMEARKSLEENKNSQTIHFIIKEILDYRKWFEFQLLYVKTGEVKKELTNKAFFQFSGGEKAMSMYVPLFSAVVAKYQGARADAPRLISLDEAFAGVDDKNVQDMFRLMVEFDFNFIINSQVLWGDYESIPSLAIYQLHRPDNAKFVTVIRYIWNGSVKSIIVDSKE